MKKTYCDICGDLIPAEGASPLAANVIETEGMQTATYGPPFPAYSACLSVHDLCTACAEAGKSIDVEAMVLGEWRRITGVGRKSRRRPRPAKEPENDGLSPESSENESPPLAPTRARRGNRAAPSISADRGASGPGSHWAKKKIIHDQLMEYRKRMGLGTLPALAEKADVSCETLRLMIEAKPVPIEEWRKVGAALDAMGVPGPAGEPADDGDI